MKKSNRKIVMIFIIVSLFCSTVFCSYGAASNEKEEVIYTMMDASGGINGAYVVNIFGQGSHLDYGNYTGVEVLNTEDILNSQGDCISFDTDADRLYYKGILDSVELPWKISIKYILDGKEITPSELAGKSGDLEIVINTDKNPACDSYYFEKYALQLTMTFDTSICKIIDSDGGTVANVGGNKQISYIILPGNAQTISVNTKVNGFHMEPISINGVKLNMDLGADGNTIRSKLESLNSATLGIDEGMSRLYSGGTALNAGMVQLTTKTEKIALGASKINLGIIELNSNIDLLETALNKLDGKSGDIVAGSQGVKQTLETIKAKLKEVSISSEKLLLLAKSSSEIATGISGISTAIDKLKTNVTYSNYSNSLKQAGIDIATLKTSNTNCLNKLNTYISNLKNQLKQIPDTAEHQEERSKITSQIELITQVIQIITANNNTWSGLDVFNYSYFQNLGTGIDNIYSNSLKLKEKYGDFDEGIKDMVDVLTNLEVQMTILSGTINTLSERYSIMHESLSEYAEKVKSIKDGCLSMQENMDTLVHGMGSLALGTEAARGGMNYIQSKNALLLGGIRSLNIYSVQLNNQTSVFAGTTGAKLSGLMNALSTEEGYCKSFLSDKNKEVKSIQFIIKTTAIDKKEEQKQVTENEKELSFWQKLLNLFGL